MINPFYILVGSVIFLIYGGLNYYIGLRGWQALFSFIPLFASKVYWPVFWLISLSFLFSRFSHKFLPTVVYEAMTLVGAYWLAFMWYFLLVITALDLVSYGTDCSHDKKGNENWELALVCNHCGYLTTIARTKGYIAEIEPVNARR